MNYEEKYQLEKRYWQGFFYAQYNQLSNELFKQKGDIAFTDEDYRFLIDQVFSPITEYTNHPDQKALNALRNWSNDLLQNHNQIFKEK